LWSILSGILFYSAWVEDPYLLPWIVWFLHQQALKELKAKAQKGAIGGSGLKKSGKK
jgi:hypothetical protein